MKKQRAKELINILNKASEKYYIENREIMSNFEYDKLYDELVHIETLLGITFSNSPTSTVGFKIQEGLNKEKHLKPMLSLQKTKCKDELKSFLGEQEGILSWKLDGLTVVLTYDKGILQKAVTRGDGIVGEIITENAKNFLNIPLNIPYNEKIIVRGEAFIKYSDFNRINENLPVEVEKYKNPRNLCSGTVRQLNTQITKQRNVTFYAFDLTYIGHFDFHTHSERFKFLENIGFEVVNRRIVNKSNIKKSIELFESEIKDTDIPFDGLVLLYDDYYYGLSLGFTSKFPKNAMAFKWEDKLVETKLKDIEWNVSRTGQINPVAIFETVDIEGTQVSKASLHNVTIFKNLQLGIGDNLLVYKANMIIPQIYKNLTCSNTFKVPDLCPICKKKTALRRKLDTEVLLCQNPNCKAKILKKIAHFCSRKAMEFEGLSEKTLEKLIDNHMIDTIPDIFTLEKYKNEIIKLDGLGLKAYNRIIKGIEDKKSKPLFKIIYGLGIENVGSTASKLITDTYGNDIDVLINLKLEDLSMIDGIGDIIAVNFVNYFKDNKNIKELKLINSYLDYKKEENNKLQNLLNFNFAITGKLKIFENRKSLTKNIEENGGVVDNSVTKNTKYLINNNKESNSSKNKKAKDLNISIITEDEYLKLL